MTDEQIEQAASGAAAELSLKVERLTTLGLGLPEEQIDPEIQKILKKDIKRTAAKHIAKALE